MYIYGENFVIFSLLVGTRASRRELDASDKMEMPSLEEHGDWLYPNEPKYQPLEMEEIDTTDKKGKKFKQPNLWQQQLDKMKEETSYNRQSRLADVNYQRHFAFNQPIVPFCCSCCCCQSMSLSYYYCPYIRPAVYQKVVAPKPITPKKSRRHDSQTN